MKQPVVLVIADRGDFAQSLLGRWHSERTVPAFTLMNSEVYSTQAGRTSDLIVVGATEPKRFGDLVGKLTAATQPVIAVVSNEVRAVNVANRNSKIMVLREHEGWLDLLMLLASECLRRIEMEERLRRAEDTMTELASQATLGRFMLDMRHGLNNALTSVLGNAELLLLEPGQFSEEVRDQLATIRSMSLRMNEIMQRFSSLDAEMNIARRENPAEVIPFSRSRAAGWNSF